ncbi:LysR family transcriptional regulator [Chromobacterium haemolyticum]|uniref:LysR family transcriptional regulator n=1 Tax=Chromobacterium haemolyticum TaxID=394935 RepID=UPI0003168332|nr:LysR family transcriptional regulator [Chromobacterium haemolyticum]QOD84758.1 LysR family transcriptional regulator [Chromobacterium haemolyticum]BBH12805.1 LysR family transcriptional regulator [Chromobacterium haemolyticum]
MDSLSGLAAFVRAAEAQSFVGAGRALGVSSSAVGKSVARLEEKLGVRLFQRSTRHVRLTAEGELFYERCRRILDDIDDAEAELALSRATPRGKLRVSLPVIGYRMLLPILPDFMQRYPEVELDLDFSDRMVDVIEEGLDAVVRSGPLADSRLMARPLGPFRLLVVGSPGYLRERGTPQSPEDLAQHACLRYRFPSTGKLQAWALDGAPAGQDWPPSSAMSCNNIEALICAASQDQGLAYLPDFIVRDALAAGRLQTVLAPYLNQTGLFHVVWPSSRQLSPKLRVFVDFLCQRLFARPEEGAVVLPTRRAGGGTPTSRPAG